MITVRELIAQLQQIPGHLPVIMQKDDEGNGYSFLRGAEECDYYETEYELEAVHPDDAPEYENLEKGVVVW